MKGNFTYDHNGNVMDVKTIKVEKLVPLVNEQPGIHDRDKKEDENDKKQKKPPKKMFLKKESIES